MAVFPPSRVYVNVLVSILNMSCRSCKKDSYYPEQIKLKAEEEIGFRRLGELSLSFSSRSGREYENDHQR